MKYLIDSYAWLEYFMGTGAGEKVKPLIESLDEKITPTICLAEVYAKTLRALGRSWLKNRESSSKKEAPWHC